MAIARFLSLKIQAPMNPFRHGRGTKEPIRDKSRLWAIKTE